MPHKEPAYWVKYSAGAILAVAVLLQIGGMPHGSWPGRALAAGGFRLHPLKGHRAGQWSVRVSGNWRVVFRFEDGEAVDVDMIDYH